MNKSALRVVGLMVRQSASDRTEVVISAELPNNIELDPDDVSHLLDLLAEAAERLDKGGREGVGEGEPANPEPEQPRRRRRAEPEPEAKPEPEPEQPRRRRRAEPEPEAKPEPAKEEPVRRRRRAEPEEPKGPTAEDVAKAASEGAMKLGPKVMSEIIGDYSETGKIADISVEKRQEFIDEVNYNLSDD